MKLDERIFKENISIQGKDLELLLEIDEEAYCELLSGLEESLEKTKEEDEESCVWNEFASGLTFNLINVDGVLYQALLKYYGSQKELLNRVRGAVFIDIDIERFLIWQCGCGYNVIDADLLDGDGSGETIKKFIEKIN